MPMPEMIVFAPGPILLSPPPSLSSLLIRPAGTSGWKTPQAELKHRYPEGLYEAMSSIPPSGCVTMMRCENLTSRTPSAASECQVLLPAEWDLSVSEIE